MGNTDEQIDAALASCKEQYGNCEREIFKYEQPAHEVCFEKPFWIDVYEVTNSQFAAFGGKAAEPSEWTDAGHPRETVSWEEADAFCQKRGARLPTEAEWEYAARGPDGLVYPWGNKWQRELIVWMVKQTASAGSKPGGISWIGAYDLSGNVWEFVEDHFEIYPSEPQIDPVVGPGSFGVHVARGGGWDNNDTLLPRATTRFQFGVSHGESEFGFRCALSYQP